MSDTIHLHQNIVNRKRNTIFLFLPTLLFIFFLLAMFSVYKVQQVRRDEYEATLGDETSVDSNNILDRK